MANRKPFVWSKFTDADVDCYHAMLHKLIADGHTGHWALFHKGQFIGVAPTLEGALRSGYDAYGLGDGEEEGYSFTVKEIEPMQEWERKFWIARENAEIEYASWLAQLAKDSGA